MGNWIAAVTASAVGALIATAFWHKRHPIFHAAGRCLQVAGLLLFLTGLGLVKKGGSLMLLWEHLLLPNVG